MQQLDESFRMLDTFASVGATHFDVTFTNIDGEKRGFRSNQSISQLKNSLPKLFPGATDRQNNIIIRPISEKTHLVQLDDLGQEALKRVEALAFLTHETSPGNHQAWVAVSGFESNENEEAKDFSRRLKKGSGADLNATGATRIAGTVNYKREYEHAFPAVRICSSHPGRIISKEQFDVAGLLAPEETRTVTTSFVERTQKGRGSGNGAKVWPSYARSLAGAPLNRKGTGPDRSMADWDWCMTAIDWGWSIEDTAAKLSEVSEKARERIRLKDTGYPLITAENAAVAVQRNDLKRGRG